jgi:predicted metal-binding protein
MWVFRYWSARMAPGVDMDCITICATCAAPGQAPEGAALAEAVRDGLREGCVLRLVDCVNVCHSPVALSIRGAGKTAYLFAGVDPAAQAAEIRKLADLYAEAAGGDITDARPLGALRHCLIGRIPA